MWKIWLIFSVFKFSFSAPVDQKKDSVGASGPNSLGCLLLSTPLTSCHDIKNYSNNIPKRLQKLYDKVKKPFLDATHNESTEISTNDIIPTSLLYLIPRIRLQNMTGHVAASILQRSPNDEALAMKLASLLATDLDRQAFLEELPHELSAGGHLSQGVERELGRALTTWYPVGGDWQYWQFGIALSAGSPVLAYLPSHFINRMVHPVAEKFVFHLRNWRPEDPNTSQMWDQHPYSVKRIWTSTALKKLDRPQLWFPAVVRLSSYLLQGATPDEIPLMASYVADKSQMIAILQLKLNALQARALFDVIQTKFPALLDDINISNIITNLLPRQIQQFDPATTNLIDTPQSSKLEGSFLSQSQIVQHQIAHLVYKNKLESLSSATWNDGIGQLGKLVHLLPSSVLEAFKNDNLSIETIFKIDSNFLNFRQSRYLTSANTYINFKETNVMLKALPAHEINIQTPASFPENVQRNLLRRVPGKSRALVSVLLEKSQLDIDDRPFLSAILENEDHNEILRLLSSRDLASRFRNLAQSLGSLATENETLRQKIRSLPPNIGTLLLAEFRRDIIGTEDGWTMDNLIENPSNPLLKLLISNLQCTDLELVNDVDVVPILGYYVRERRNLGLAFPKNMQYCCQKALTRYLKLKSVVRQWSDESTGLLNLLELFEVRAVGGYILSSLPLDVIQSALLKNHIIREIGTLPLSELITATSLSNLRALANVFGKHSGELHLREISELGNLVWFLDAEHARRINTAHFKLWLEMIEPTDARAPCFTATEREFWRELLMQTLGKPDTWSAGSLSLLGDLLFVFEEADFEAIDASVRAEASDSLAKFTTFHKQVEWAGKLTTITYYEACVEALSENEKSSYKSSVRTLLRFYLESAQMAMNTIIPADMLLRLDNAVEEDSKENILNIDEPLNGKIKRSIGSKRGRIFKRVLSDIQLEERKQEFLANGTRALVIVLEAKDDNNTKIDITETFPRKNLKISCDAIKMVGMGASFVLDEEDLSRMTNDELEDCSEVLGSLNLAQNVRKAIWPRLSKWKESNNLLEVGNLVSVIEEDDITSLSLDISKPWSLESLAVLSEHVVNGESLSLIGDKFILDNPNIRATSLRFGTAAALGRIICKWSKSRQEKMLDHPGLFVQLAPLLGSTIGDDDFCIHHMLPFAKLAYGPPSEWTAEDVSSLGVIVSGLSEPDWHKSGLKAESLSGLSPEAVSRIPPEVFKELSEDHLSKLPALSVAAISPAQSLSLSPAQSEVLERVRRQVPDKDLRATRSSSGSFTLTPSIFTTWFAVVLTTIKFVF